MSEQLQVKNNEAARRFEAKVGGELAVAEYQRRGDTIIFTHTEVPDELEGQGSGGELVRAALDHARTAGLRVVPACAFVASYIERHSEYQSLLAAEQS